MKWIAKLLHVVDRKKDRGYVSPADRFLQEFDAENPAKSPSQLAEIKKHQNIFTRTAGGRINWN